MIILYTGILLICLLFFSIISKKNINPYWGFTFVLLIMGFQSNVQGDFYGYMYDFEHGVASDVAYKEPLWQILLKLFRLFNWKFFVFCLSLFQCYVLYRLSKKYNTQRFILLSAVLFFFNYDMMLIQMKAMREGLAIELCLLPYLFDLERGGKKWKLLKLYAPCIAAYLIHNSALVAIIPVTIYYLLESKADFLKQNSNKHGEFFFPVVMTAIFLLVYSAKVTLLSGFFTQLGEYATINDYRLGAYLDKDMNIEASLSDLFVLYDAIIVFVASWFFRITDRNRMVFCLMIIAACYVNVLFFGMGALFRIGCFFTVGYVAISPNIASAIEERFGKGWAYAFIVLCIGYAIKSSFPILTTTEGNNFADYQFIFMQ